MKKRIASIFLTLCMLLTLLPTMAAADGTTGNWANHADTSWYNSAYADFTISTAAQLAGLASLVNSGTLAQGGTFMLTADIDLSAYAWAPIGTAASPFVGVFDGGGHSITGLTASVTGDSADACAGLFGHINNSSVSGLSVTGTVSATATGSSNNAYAGLVAGYCVSSAFTSCTANVSALSAACSSDRQAFTGGIAGNVSGSSSIINCTVSISGTAASTVYAGGIAGYLSNYSSVTNCAVTVGTNGKIAAETGNCTYAGGIAGVSAGTIGNCSISGSGAVTATATGSSSKADAGGIAGLSSGNIFNCNNTLAVTAANAVGGCVGDNSNGGIVTNCYWLATENVNKGLSCAGGGTVTNCGSYDTSGNLTLSGSGTLAASTLLAALNAYVAMDTNDTSLRYWQVPEGGTYPAFCTTWIEALNAKKSAYAVTVSGNQASIASAWDLAWLSKTVIGGAAQSGVTFTQTADIDLSLYDWIPVGYAVYTKVFSGTYDGGSKSITGMNVNLTAKEEAFGGLFAYLDGATVRSCHVSGSVRTIATAGGSPSYAGGIAGFSKGSTVTGCAYTGSVCGVGAYSAKAGGIVGSNSYSSTVSDCTAAGVVSAVQTGSSGNSAMVACAGGIVGSNGSNCNVKNCLHTGKVSADGASAAQAGGVAGDNSFYIFNCGQLGAVTASGKGTGISGGIVGHNTYLVNNCYAVGAVSAAGNVGGVVGKNDSSNVSNCYFQQSTAINPDLPAAGGNDPKNCGVFADAGGALTKIGNGELAAANLSDALNTWVSGQQTPADYQTWVVKSGENGGYPVFGDVWKLTLNANDGTQVPATTLHFVAKNAAVGTMPVATGDLLFDSWNTAATGIGTTINTSYTPTADTTLYARWVQPALDVAYGRITGTTSTMQYSLDGGITKTQCKPDSTHTTSVTFSAGNDVRVYANGSEIKLGTISTAAKTTTAPHITAVTDSSITLDTVNGYEYCFGGSSDITKTMGFTGDGGDFIGDGNAHTITGLNAATQYYIFCRTAGAATALPSDTVLSVGTVTAYAAPVADAYTLGDNNVLTFDSTKYEVSTAADFTGTAIDTGATLTDKTAYYIRHKARAADGGLYAVPAGTPLVFVCGVRAVLSDFSTISGAVDTAITPVAGVTLTLTGATFSNVVANTTTFATNISGITAKVTAVTGTTATLTLSGTPQKKFSGSVRVTIPKTNLTDGQASLTSDLNSGAAANIAGIACEFSGLTLTPANTQASNQNIHLAVKLTANGAPLVGHHIYLQFLGGSLDYKTWWGTTDTDGVADFNPTDIITIPAGTYTVTVKYDGTAVYAAAAPATASYIVTPAVISGGGSAGSSSTSTTTTNADGSTTTKVTDSSTGTVTETTKAKDGGTTVVETKKDGTVTTAATDKTGNTVQTVKKSDGSMTSSETRTDGTKITSATTAAGKTTAAVTASGKTDVTVPAALGKTDGKVSAKVSYPDGTKETVTASYSGGKVSLSVDGSAAVEILDDFVPLSAMPFTDVPNSAYYRDAVLWAVGKDVTDGTTPATFSPAAKCTRAQVMTFLWRTMGSPEPAGAKNSFTDVSADAYYYKAVLWAAEKGVTTGATDTTFSPDDTVTRAEFVTLLWRAAGSPSQSGASKFADVTDTTAYYYQAVLWAAGQGITDGTTPTTFGSGGICNRAQVVTFLYRHAGK